MLTPCRLDSLDMLMQVIRAEYLDMPGLRLTPAQCRRLWDLDEDLCDRATARLVAEGFLDTDQWGRLYWRAQ